MHDTVGLGTDDVRAQRYAKVRIGVVSLIALYFAVFETLLFTTPSRELASDVLINVLYLACRGATVYACFWASRRTTTYKRLWFLLGVGMACWFVYGCASWVGAVTRDPSNSPSPSVFDLLMLGYMPIFLGVLLTVGRVKPPFDPEKKRYLASVAIVALSSLLVVLEFVLIPFWIAHNNTGFSEQALAATPIIFDGLILIALFLALQRVMENQVEGWTVFSILAAVLNVASDVPAYTYGYSKNPITLTLLSATAALIALAAIDAATGAFIGAKKRTHGNSSGRPSLRLLKKIPWSTLIWPAAITLCLPAVLVSHMSNDYPIGHTALGIISTAIVLLSLYRSHLFAIENKILSANIFVDTLTGIYNHRYFQEGLAQAVLRSTKTNRPVSLIVIDVDDFSLVNSRFGHSFGDKTLAAIGTTLRASVRMVDEACRLGSDKFAVIVPDMDHDAAFSFAEQLKTALQDTLRNVTSDMTLTVSAGVSSCPTIAKDKDELFSTADGALYWGKLRGKNSVLVYDPGIVETLSAEERAKKAEESLFLDMVASLTEAVDARDAYTRQHSQNVSRIAGQLACALSLDEEAIRRIEAAGILHDIGKIGIPDHILNKPGRLTDEEMAAIKQHPVFSAQIIKSTSMRAIADIVKAHHERWDGAGYPDGLKGEKIPVEARILAIADTYDAMTTDRPYRCGLTTDEALAEIKRCSGTQFDPKLAAVFISTCKGGAPAKDCRQRTDPSLAG